MVITLAYARSRFDYFNELCFGSQLKPVAMKLSRARTFLGKCQYKKVRAPFSRKVTYTDFVLKFSVCFDLPQEELDDVILHEMIHYHIASSGIRDSSAHGPVFRSYMQDFNTRFGRHITISRRIRANAVAAQTARGPKVCVVCVSEFKDGTRGVTVCARTRVASINRDLSRYYPLKSHTWYVSASPIFARYPRSIKARIYRITPEDLAAALNDSRAL